MGILLEFLYLMTSKIRTKDRQAAHWVKLWQGKLLIEVQIQPHNLKLKSGSDVLLRGQEKGEPAAEAQSKPGSSTPLVRAALVLKAGQGRPPSERLATLNNAR